PALVSVPAGAGAHTIVDADANGLPRRPAAPPVATPASGPVTGLDDPPMVFSESSGPETGDDGLPHRVRQANLAPGLRTPVNPPHAPGAPHPAMPDIDDEPAARSPEQARATMSAYQRGWTLGRDAAEPVGPDGS
ncbi:MAG: hypothetical protein ACRDVE_15625, partial [Actinocrinis sp.]